MLRPLRLASDAELAERARGGADDAAGELMRRYRGPLVRHCARLVGDDGADDAVQHAFLRMLESLRGPDGTPQEFRPWLFRVARNAAVDMLRARAREGGPIEVETACLAHAPAEVLERRGALRDVIDSVRRLPQRQREALVLRAVDGRSYDEIGAALEAGEGVVRQLIHRAREGVRAAAAAVLVPPWLLRALFGRAPAGGGAGAALSGGAAAKGASVLLTAGVVLAGGAVAAHHAATSRPAPAPVRARVPRPEHPASAAPSAILASAKPPAHRHRAPSAKPARHRARRTHRASVPVRVPSAVADPVTPAPPAPAPAPSRKAPGDAPRPAPAAGEEHAPSHPAAPAQSAPTTTTGTPASASAPETAAPRPSPAPAADPSPPPSAPSGTPAPPATGQVTDYQQSAGYGGPLTIRRANGEVVTAYLGEKTQLTCDSVRPDGTLAGQAACGPASLASGISFAVAEHGPNQFGNDVWTRVELLVPA